MDLRRELMLRMLLFCLLSLLLHHHAAAALQGEVLCFPTFYLGLSLRFLSRGVARLGSSTL